MHLVQKILKTFCDILASNLKSGVVNLRHRFNFMVDNSNGKNRNRVKIAPQIETHSHILLNENLISVLNGYYVYFDN